MKCLVFRAGDNTIQEYREIHREMKCFVFRAGDNTIQEYREIER